MNTDHSTRVSSVRNLSVVEDRDRTHAKKPTSSETLAADETAAALAAAHTLTGLQAAPIHTKERIVANKPNQAQNKQSNKKVLRKIAPRPANLQSASSSGDGRAAVNNFHNARPRKDINKTPKTPTNPPKNTKVGVASVGSLESSSSSKRSADDAGLEQGSEPESGATPQKSRRRVARPAPTAKKTTSSKRQRVKARDAEFTTKAPDTEFATPSPNTLQGDAAEVGDGDHEMTDTDGQAHSDNETARTESTDDSDKSKVTKKDSPSVEDRILVEPTMTTKQRVVDEVKDAALISTSQKASKDIYDSDAEDDPAVLTSVKHPEWYRNVKWGSAAYLGSGYYKEDEPFEATTFTQFVPGRWERMPDGTLRDQKEKCIIKLVNKDGKRMIFRNAPPKDWNHQPSLTAMNKRSVQQIRRNTKVRFRAVVTPYVQAEREWILKNLDKQSKPIKGWTRFVHEFNSAFAGKVVEGSDEPRHARSKSSLTKEVERFAKEFYSKGNIPSPQSKVKQQAGGKKTAAVVPDEVPESIPTGGEDTSSGPMATEAAGTSEGVATSAVTETTDSVNTTEAIMSTDASTNPSEDTTEKAADVSEASQTERQRSVSPFSETLTNLTKEEIIDFLKKNELIDRLREIPPKKAAPRTTTSAAASESSRSGKKRPAADIEDDDETTKDDSPSKKRRVSDAAPVGRLARPIKDIKGEKKRRTI